MKEDIEIKDLNEIRRLKVRNNKLAQYICFI